MVKHTVAVCNYNMVETVERSLRAMLDQLDDTFEMVVVDGGSQDGSLEILRDLEDEYEMLRVVSLRPDSDRYLGADRNTSFEASAGEYILESLDCDDYYDNIIVDFTDLYHQIEEQVDFEFMLHGWGINIAPRSLLLDVPYYNLGGAEDRDLWRRLFARDAMIWLQHDSIGCSLGYEKSLMDEINRDIHGKICDFQSGITLKSALEWSLSHPQYGIVEKDRSYPARQLKKAWDFGTHLYAYAKARGRPHHEAPEQFKEKGSVEKYIYENRMTVSDIEETYGIEIDTDRLSKLGQKRLVK
ncbi:glycosyltransferase family 2 protein [Halogeometricum limi]|uniref:Glycosyl transferase family 2 n=1 Tax=Halogeometricum limi TaxID=555875 RepID=A0A1I6GGL3_9EURY|nr:glycosyltransferase family A protein [Halogeometricum limi]SFR41342.1 Glycosyl transferase family 2 [Halogeometricum limi]